LQAAVIGQDIVFVAVPTPHDPAYGGESPTARLRLQCGQLGHNRTQPACAGRATVLPGTVPPAGRSTAHDCASDLQPVSDRYGFDRMGRDQSRNSHRRNPGQRTGRRSRKRPLVL
jgi:hypothetical protein